jgi:hemerythrin superfamily protein
MDAIELITRDHRTVESLFAEFDQAGSAQRRGEVFGRIKQELDAHAAIEEELLYPVVARADAKSREEVERAFAEHRLVKTLLRETAAMDARDKGFAANVTVLRRNVEEHVAEEEGPGGVLERASRVLGDVQRRDLGREMQEHRQAIASGSGRGILTAAAEAVQSILEKGQKAMDRATSASRGGMKAGASAARAARRPSAAAGRSASHPSAAAARQSPSASRRPAAKRPSRSGARTSSARRSGGPRGRSAKAGARRSSGRRQR